MSRTEKYKELRSTFQKGIGINRDKLYNSPAPLEMLDKTIFKSVIPEKSWKEFLETVRDAGNQTPKNWFDQISYDYIAFDMAGFMEDKIKVSDKKQDTFKNTIEDSFHAAFASQCDIYVTNDDRNFHKTVEVYKKLNVNTKVYKADRFMGFIKAMISDEESSMFFDRVVARMKELEVYGAEENPGLQIFYLNDFLLDYFNKIYYVNNPEKVGQEDNWMITLTKEKPSNGRTTFIKDMDMIIAKLIQLFGIPQNNDLMLNQNEVTEVQNTFNWNGRKWVVGNLLVKLLTLEGYLQLYIYPISREPIPD